MTSDWVELYHAVNQMVLEIGENGGVTSKDDVFNRVMDALYEIDGGVYNKRMKGEI
jgi:hypothetical protein